MHIDINGDTERLIQSGLASGEFETAEEAIAAMAIAWAKAKQSRAGEVPRLSPSTDIRTLVATQGIRPFDPTAEKPDFWPPEESSDEFLAFLHQARNDEPTGRKNE